MYFGKELCGKRLHKGLHSVKCFSTPRAHLSLKRNDDSHGHSVNFFDAALGKSLTEYSQPAFVLRAEACLCRHTSLYVKHKIGRASGPVIMGTTI